MATAQLQDLHLQLAQPQGHLAGEGDGGPGHACGHALDVLEQAWKAADLAGLVLLATLHDEVVGVLAGNDVLGAIGRCPQHAHRMVVAQRHIADGLVGHLADAADHVLRHHGRGLGVDHHHRVVADDDAGVRIAFGGVGPGMLGQLLERHLLHFGVGMGGKGFGVHGGR
ncbi:hypothetical protein D3C72_1804450 [compost metagenome]